MTTATEHDVDLEAWMQGEIEKPCDVGAHGGGVCGKPAHFLAHAKCNTCAGVEQRFACHGCHADLVAGVRFFHRPCGYRSFVKLTWVERLK